MCLGRSAISVICNELLFQETGGGWCATGTPHFEDIHKALVRGGGGRGRTPEGGFDAG